MNGRDLLTGVLGLGSFLGAGGERDNETARNRMVDRLERQGRASDRVAAAMRAVPRHAFVPPERQEKAYADRPLPIGEGQTISAPHMVAEMAEQLDLESGTKVLEIGTGRGYHAAVTAELVGPENVYSVEYQPGLAEAARETLSDLGYGAIDIRVGDGHEGWPDHAPYDAAYLTCAADEFPDAVIEQVRSGGQLLGPIGTRVQRLVSAEKQPSGRLQKETHGRVRFVTMQGGS